MAKRRDIRLIALKGLVVSLCLGGFLYQTLQFLLLYWTYPTVVDIQQTAPSYLQLPAFTFCNPIGYNLHEICYGYGESPCIPTVLLKTFKKNICEKYPPSCYNGSIPKNFKVVNYEKFRRKVTITPEDHKRLSLKLTDYLNCTIEFAGTVKKCNMENVMGSFYSKEDLPQYCFSLYSLWGKPNKKREVIPKGATMKFSIFLNASRNNDTDIIDPQYFLPTNPSIQMAVHSPYFLPSPYIQGSNYLAGQAYELTITMNERHLLPLPYKTNCTDYMKTWRERGGKAPINQLGIVQECRMKEMYARKGCVPVTVDYPHSYNICRSCNPCEDNIATDNCTMLADNFNQPCDSETYATVKENRIISRYDSYNSKFLTSKVGAIIRILQYDCEGAKYWSKECSTLEIDVLFDRFEITNITYNPKYESLEVFSVIGGYMGMWLGVSLLAVYDFIGTIIMFIKSKIKKRKRKKVTPFKKLYY
ncbi:degenerin-like protein asic-1 [Stegodyphus dumicola]|uniref:degenerin-like protein asic-1 n=1 Tax=Stegodyphus dumicola TaxID=202533 RepID=UPI0015ACA111|nr:degenerin-like protein asic-1 [Stegodyphus dumicola]